MRGPKPKPTGLKLLRGERRDRMNPNEPPVLPGMPAAPEWLDAEARAAWDRVVPLLERARVISQTDADALVIYCVLWSVWRKATAELAVQGFTVTTNRKGSKTNPLVAIAMTASKQLLTLAAEFGMTPSSRSRVTAAPSAEPNDLERFLAQRGV